MDGTVKFARGRFEEMQLSPSEPARRSAWCRAGAVSVLGLGLFAGCRSPSDSRNDFNDDGFDDLPIGDPGELLLPYTAEDPLRQAGAVHVVYGSSQGLAADHNQYWHQPEPGAPSQGVQGESAEAEQFGASLAAGDFDGDGYGDLAIGVPRETETGSKEESGTVVVGLGGVHVFYGGSGGLSANRNKLIYGDTLYSGTSLAEGDFDHDGFDDLAIGCPYHDVTFDGQERTNAGAVHVYYGSSVGLTADRPQLWHEDGGETVSGLPDIDEWFGIALSSGDFNGDTYDDLAIGAFNGKNDATGPITNPTGQVDEDDEVLPYPGSIDLTIGVVHVIFGGRNGLHAEGAQMLHQDIYGVKGTAASGEQFGYSLQSGQFDSDRFYDLAIGVPNDGKGEVVVAGGAVNVLYGTDQGLTALNDQYWRQETLGFVDAPESAAVSAPEDRFGTSLAAGDFNGDGYGELVIGAASEMLIAGGEEIPECGVIHVLFGSNHGLQSQFGFTWSQNDSGGLERAETFDHFGSDLAVADFDGDGRGELVCQAMFEKLTETIPSDPGRGIVLVLYFDAKSGNGADWAVGTVQVWHEYKGLLGWRNHTDSFGKLP